MSALSPRERRVLEVLILRPHSRKELGTLVGALNVPQHVFTLRRKGWKIICKRFVMKDRDGRPCAPGIYDFADNTERKRALKYLEKDAFASARAVSDESTNNLDKQDINSIFRRSQDAS